MSVQTSPEPKPKTSSPRRQAASRANGAKSRGPVTPEGKQRSSQNARVHGLASKTVVLSNEEWPNFLALRASYIERLRPADAAELDLVEEMVAARWRLQRSWTMEAAALDDALEAQRVELDAVYEHVTKDVRTALAFKKLTDESNFASALNRYETRASRQFFRCLKALRDMRVDFPLAPPTSGDKTSSAAPAAENMILPNEPSPISGHSDLQLELASIERPVRAAIRRETQTELQPAQTSNQQQEPAVRVACAAANGEKDEGVGGANVAENAATSGGAAVPVVGGTDAGPEQPRRARPEDHRRVGLNRPGNPILVASEAKQEIADPFFRRNNAQIACKVPALSAPLQAAVVHSRVVQERDNARFVAVFEDAS